MENFGRTKQTIPRGEVIEINFERIALVVKCFGAKYSCEPIGSAFNVRVENFGNARSVCERILTTLQLWDLIVTTFECQSIVPLESCGT